MISTMISATTASDPAVLVAVVGLISLLIARVLANTTESTSARILDQQVRVFTQPLLILFASLVVISLLDYI